MIGVPARPGFAAAVRLLVATLALATWSHAQGSCLAPDGPWLALTFEGNSWPAHFTERVQADFQAGLGERALPVCVPEAGARPPLATVTIAERQSGKAVLIRVSDTVTGKRVERDVDLAALPLDGRALAVAVAADELLRASWAELALRRRPEPRITPRPRPRPPPEVARVVTDSLPGVPRSSLAELGARAALEHYGGGQLHYGVDLFYRHPIGAPLRAEVAVGMRDARSHRTAEGVVSARAYAAELRLSTPLLVSQSVVLEAFAGARVQRVTFRGEASARYSGLELTGYPVFGRAGVQATLELGSWLFLFGSIAAGAPLHAVHAKSSTGETITAVSGLELAGAAGLLVGL